MLENLVMLLEAAELKFVVAGEREYFEVDWKEAQAMVVEGAAPNGSIFLLFIISTFWTSVTILYQVFFFLHCSP